MLPVPNMRPLYLQTVNRIIKGAKSFVTVGQLLHDLQDNTDRLKVRFPHMTKEEQTGTLENLNINLRSFKSLIMPIIDGIFSLDHAALKRQKNTESIVALSWIQAAAESPPELDLQKAWAASKEMMTKLRESQLILAEPLLDSTESILFAISTVRRLPDDKKSSLRDLVIEQIKAMLVMAQDLHDYDDYEKELTKLTVELKNRLASLPLSTIEARELFRELTQQLQWRQQVTRFKLPDRLAHLESNPEDFAAAHALYTDLLTLLPFRVKHI